MEKLFAFSFGIDFPKAFSLLQGTRWQDKWSSYGYQEQLKMYDVDKNEH